MNWATLVNAANLSDDELRCTPDTLAESCHISEAEVSKDVDIILCMAEVYNAPALRLKL